MSAVEAFNYAGYEMRTVMIDGEPWFVATDIADVLGYRNAPDALRHVDDDDKGVAKLRTPGGAQDLRTVNESGLFSLILRSHRAEAREFKRWVTHEVLPSIRRTGIYQAAPSADLALDLTAIRQLNAAVTHLLEQNQQVTARAEVAEEFKRAIDTSDGLTLRQFHKHYLPDVPERKFFEFLYAKRLLIDQRGQRRNSDGSTKPGSQHGHPAFGGKQFFYLHATVDRFGDRHENTRVRPGDAEIALSDYLQKHLTKEVAA